MKPMKIMKNADKFLNDHQNMYLPKDHPSYSAIEALLHTKNVFLSDDVKVFDVIVDSSDGNVWIWLEADDDHRNTSYSFTKAAVKEILSRPSAYMKVLRNASYELTGDDTLDFGSEADMVIRGILAEFGTSMEATDKVLEISFNEGLISVSTVSGDDYGNVRSYEFNVEFVSDYERLVNLKGELHVLQTKFVLA